MDNIVFETLQKLEEKYAKNQRAIKFNFRDFVTANLDIKRSDVYTHNLRSYPGRLFPYIPIFFLSTNKLCPTKGKVFDPFAGSGTVLLESIVNPYYKRDVYGIEMNPLGRLISKVKTTPINPRKLDNKFNLLFKLINAGEDKKKYRSCIPNFKNIDFWYSKKAKSGLSKLKFCIDQLKDDDCKDFFWVCFSKLVRDVSRADPHVPPPVLLKVQKYKDSYRYEKLKALVARNENPDVVGIFEKIISENLERIKRLWKVKEVQGKKIESKIIWDDSRCIKRGKYFTKGIVKKKLSRPIKNSISLIITSPPYLSAQKYTRTTKLELFWLGMASEEELVVLDKQTIGTERISLLVDIQSIGISSIDNLLKKIGKHSKERMLVSYEYFRNMIQVLEQCYGLLKKDGFMVLIVGNNKVGNVVVNTTKLLIDIAKEIGFKDALVLRDEIRGRGMLTKRHGTGGLIKDEFVIVLKKQEGNKSGKPGLD